jgi:hypothetical protein
MFQTTKSKILSEMSAFAGRGLLSDITFATNTYSRMHPSIQGTYCKMHSAFICQTIYVGREPLGGERKKKCTVHIVHQLSRGKESKNLHMGTYAILQHHQKNTEKN